MTYNANIPQATDDPSVSQAQLLANFGKLNTDFSVDHTAFTASSDVGKHKKATLLESATPTTSAGEGALYAKNTSGTREILYYRRESNGSDIPVGIIGAFVKFDSSGVAIGTPFNCSIARVATGRYEVTFTTAMADGNYIVLVTPAEQGRIFHYDSSTTASVFVEARNRSDGNTVDTSMNVMIFGEISA